MALQIFHKWNFFKKKMIERHLVFYEPGLIPDAQIHGLRLALTLNQKSFFETCPREKADIRKLRFKPSPKAIWIQAFWNTSPDAMTRFIGTIRQRWPDSPIIYLDWFAPTDLRNAYLFELCDVYVKKHVLRDRDSYAEGFHDTNLVEYESRWNKAFLTDRHQGIAKDSLKQKLIIGWNFATDKRLISELLHPVEINGRPIDLHCRIAAPNDRSNWYGHMRGRCIDAAERINVGRVIAEAKRLKWKQYMNELRRSKLCFSPFGYGECCWRDFEAIASGAVLVKPDMSHIETYPNIYIAHKTYAPVKWDLSDLEEVCEFYLTDEAARKSMVKEARRVWVNAVQAKFVVPFRHIENLIGKSIGN